jgi:NADH-quinone oxidoreductase subunit H
LSLGPRLDLQLAFGETMNWPRALAIFAAALAFAGLLALAAPWAAPVGPPLVGVSSLSPTDVEPGDRIVIAGDGFPPGKEARVRFRGTLQRPGERPIRDAEVTLTGVVSGADEVDVEFGEATQALFCGAGDRAVHTTFTGEVEVAFAAAAPGAAPVAGTLQQAVLDVRPSASGADRAREGDGLRSLAFLGLRVTAPTRRGIGLTVESVQPRSPADAAGVVAGDAITSFDGVRASAVGDLVPEPGERQATLGIRQAGATTETLRPVTVDGFRRAPPAELFDAAIVIAAALAVVLLAGASAPAVVAAALQRASARLRARGGPRAIATAAALEVLPPATGAAAADMLGMALLAVMPFGQYLVAARLDVAILFVAASALLAVAAVVVSGAAWAGLHAAVHVAWQHVPAGLAVACVVVATGSLRVQEIARAQGGCPWDWLAFRSPGALLALALLLACTRISPASAAPHRSALEALVEDVGPLPSPSTLSPGASPGRSGSGGWSAAACRVHRLLVAGLATALFLGGWSLPGLSPEQQDGRVLLELAGALGLVAKTGALVVVLAVLRQALPGRTLPEASRATARRGGPLAVAALAMTALWNRWSPEGPAQLFASGSLVAAAGLAGIVVLRRLHHGVFAAGADGHLSPFL